MLSICNSRSKTISRREGVAASTSGLPPRKSPPKQDGAAQQPQGAKKGTSSVSRFILKTAETKPPCRAVPPTSADILVAQRNGLKVPAAVEKPKSQLLKKKTPEDSAKKPGLGVMSPQRLRDLYNVSLTKVMSLGRSFPIFAVLFRRLTLPRWTTLARGETWRPTPD
jgi:hypothetical protein